MPQITTDGMVNLMAAPLVQPYPPTCDAQLSYHHIVGLVNKMSLVDADLCIS